MYTQNQVKKNSVKCHGTAKKKKEITIREESTITDYNCNIRCQRTRLDATVYYFSKMSMRNKAETSRDAISVFSEVEIQTGLIVA